jgi:hypothetical protein
MDSSATLDSCVVEGLWWSASCNAVLLSTRMIKDDLFSGWRLPRLHLLPPILRRAIHRLSSPRPVHHPKNLSFILSYALNLPVILIILEVFQSLLLQLNNAAPGSQWKYAPYIKDLTLGLPFALLSDFRSLETKLVPMTYPMSTPLGDDRSKPISLASPLKSSADQSVPDFDLDHFMSSSVNSASGTTERENLAVTTTPKPDLEYLTTCPKRHINKVQGLIDREDSAPEARPSFQEEQNQGLAHPSTPSTDSAGNAWGTSFHKSSSVGGISSAELSSFILPTPQLESLYQLKSILEAATQATTATSEVIHSTMSELEAAQLTGFVNVAITLLQSPKAVSPDDWHDKLMNKASDMGFLLLQSAWHLGPNTSPRVTYRSPNRLEAELRDGFDVCGARFLLAYLRVGHTKKAYLDYLQFHGTPAASAPEPEVPLVPLLGRQKSFVLATSDICWAALCPFEGLLLDKTLTVREICKLAAPSAPLNWSVLREVC